MHKFPAGAGFGALFVVIGLGMMGGMALDQSRLNVPLWVGEIAASCFAFAGASILAQTYNKLRLSRAFSLGVVYALGVPGLWIAFGSDGSGCTGTASLGPISFSEFTSGMPCRIVFGFGAVITLACAVALTYAILRTFSAKAAERDGEPADRTD